MNIFVILFFILSFKDLFLNRRPEARLILFFWGIVVSILVVYSLLLGNDPKLVIRFSVIIFLLISAYYVSPRKIFIDIFLIVISIQALFLIWFELYMMENFTAADYSPIRNYFRNMDWGDVYTYGGSIWKIQLLGNALIPFAFFTSVVYLRGFMRIFASILFLMALLIAGNFAFIIGTLLFSVSFFVIHLTTFNRLVVGVIFIVVLSTIIAIPALDYLFQVIESKSISSNQIRIDQIMVLVDDMSSTFRSIIFGNGLGHTVDVRTNWRDYTGDIYYELQALYFVNQMGSLVVFFIIFNILCIYMFIRNTYALMIYFSYLFYALFNPYFLDTNHIVAIIVSVSVSHVLTSREGVSDAYTVISDYGVYGARRL